MALRLTTRLAPPVPPAIVPMVTPSYVTLAPTTLICPALRMLNMSSPATPLLLIATVRLPPAKSAESLSLTVALPLTSISTAPPPCVKVRLSPLRLPITGALLGDTTTTEAVRVVLPMSSLTLTATLRTPGV
ncbi:hypothetical protein D3C81_1507590 [compost metagenome]